nr:hypothetical protein Iba_chr08bCG11390 [Ipomoea batatas]
MYPEDSKTVSRTQSVRYQNLTDLKCIIEVFLLVFIEVINRFTGLPGDESGYTKGLLVTVTGKMNVKRGERDVTKSSLKQIPEWTTLTEIAIFLDLSVKRLRRVGHFSEKDLLTVTVTAKTDVKEKGGEEGGGGDGGGSDCKCRSSTITLMPLNVLR